MTRTVSIVGSSARERRVVEEALRRSDVLPAPATGAEVIVVLVDDPASIANDIAACRERARGAPIVAVGPPQMEVAVEAFRNGASDYVARPLDGDAVRAAVERQLPAERSEGLRPLRKSDLLLGESAGIRAVRDRLDRAAASPLSVLITGESGTGKELAARALHYGGPRRAQPFVAVNAAALQDSLAEAELFGSRRGAFTGADRDRAGLFSEANRGTLFLDEIGNASPGLQAKLLRALEHGEVTPVGASRAIAVDVRVVAATNADLKRATASGTFREDLFFRLGAIQVHMPPLRERLEDLPLLAAHHLALLAARAERPVPRVSKQALALFGRHSWPGNVRELVNVLGCALLACNGEVIRAEDVRFDDPTPSSRAIPSFREARRKFEEAYVREVLAAAGGSIAEAARLAGRERKDFYALCRRAGVDLSEYRPRLAEPEADPPSGPPAWLRTAKMRARL